MAPSLFTHVAPRPLADALRPQRLGDVIGQRHLLGPDGPLHKMVQRKRLASFVLWGPPGVGKTTISRLIATEAGYEFVQLSAVSTGIADLRRVIAAAADRKAASGRPTAAFIDELHRFSRPVQDALLPAVEDGTIVLIGATTENPSFSLVAALLSRATVFTLDRLDADALVTVLRRAEEHVGKPLPIDAEATRALLAMADGDARYLLGLCETLFFEEPAEALDVAAMSAIVQKRAPVYDKGQEEHFNLLSCFHKSLRGSDPDAALYWAARMLAGGEDAAVIFRRLTCAASEDVGMADPQALVQVMTAWQAFERVGLPEGRLFLAQAINYVSTAPKSNASYVAFDRARALARETGSLPPPRNILNAPTKLMKELGYGKVVRTVDGCPVDVPYQYDHDTPEGFSGHDFLPDGLGPQRFYEPVDRGFERRVRERLAYWADLKARKRDERGW